MIKTLALDTPNIKITDNDTPIYLTPYNDGILMGDKAYTPTVYVASSKSAFTKSIPAVWSGDKVYIMSSTLADLPVGMYDVEVWLTKGAEQLIYPDYGYVKLNINQTVAGINANLISSVTVAEFRDMFNSLASDLSDDITSLQYSKLDNSALNDINTALTAKVNQSDLIETNERIDDTRDKLFRLASGAPSSASLVANMVDLTKNYVYVGNENGYVPGNWYYWDGRDWVSGGVYQATQLADNSIHFNHLDEKLQNDLSGYVTQTPAINTIGTVNVSGDVVTGFGTTSYWTRATYAVSSGQTWKITFTNTTNTTTTGHIFAVDDANNIIQRWYQGQTPKQSNVDYKITIPAGATQLYIQSFDNGIIVGKLLTTSITSLINEATQLADNSIHFNHLDEKLQNDLSGYVTQTPAINTIGTVNVSGDVVTGFGTTSYWTRATYAVSSGQTWKITFTNTTNTTTTGHIFAVDDANNIIQRWYQGQTPKQSNVDYKITIPAGATQLYIQSFDNGIIVGKLFYPYYSVKDQVSDSASTVTTSMTSLINQATVNSIERVNHTAYSFISRQTTLDGFPENSIKGAVNAKNKGYDAVRVSVAFTSDDVPVLIHDLSINRVARNLDSTKITSTVNIADITLAQADNYDWGVAYGAPHVGTKTPTLENFLKVCAFKGIEPTLELKPATITNSQMKVIVNTILKYGLSSKTFITSTVLDQLTMVHSMNAQLNIGAIVNFTNTIYVDQVLAFKNDKNKVRLDIFDMDTPTIDLLNYASANGVDLKVGSAYSIADIVKWVSMGVNNIEVANVSYPATALSTYYDQTF